MSRPDLVLMGRTSGAFGLKGEIRIFLHGQDPEVLARSELIYLGPNPEAARPLTVASYRTHSGRVLLTAREVTTREQAAALAGQWVYVRRQALAPLAEGEYYWFQLKGARVATVAGRELGQVVAVGNPGPHDMLLVRAADGKEALIPVVDQVIAEMDLDGGRITVDLPLGLLAAQGWDEEGAEEDAEEGDRR